MESFRRSREEWLEVLRSISAAHPNQDDPAYLHDMAVKYMGRFVELGGGKDGDVILDVGCGTGRFAIPFTGRPITYIGVDPIAACVRRCRAAFEPWPRIRFEHCDVRNDAYNPRGSIPAEEAVFPLEDGSADAVLLCSVFTHMETIDACRHYLEEAWRVLRSGGLCVCTWFRSPPLQTSRSVEKTVLHEVDIVAAIRPWQLVYSEGGDTLDYHDQWHTVLRKPVDGPA